MDEIEIGNYLRNNPVTSQRFLGVVSRDELPAKMPTKVGFFIVNTSHSHETGRHWIVVMKLREGCIEYFDSIAKNPEYYSENILNFLYKSSKCFLMSKKRIQGEGNVCGQYCILYSYIRCSGKSMEYFLDCFSDGHLSANDSNVSLL